MKDKMNVRIKNMTTNSVLAEAKIKLNTAIQKRLLSKAAHSGTSGHLFRKHPARHSGVSGHLIGSAVG
jgi:hypothetical protein